MTIEHVKTERTETSVNYTFRVDGEEKTVGGCATWSLEAALDYFPRKRRLAEAFAACVKDPDNFIGASYRENLGIPAGCER